MRLRPELDAFADLMEKVLRRNDHKGHWCACTTSYLFSRLVEEVGELGRSIDEERAKDRIRKEAADVANFAMMIADVVGGLIP